MARPRPRPGFGRPGARLLREPLEDVRQERGSMPAARVGHDQACGPVDRVDPHVHAAAAGRELDGVGEQVRDDLLQALRVAPAEERLALALARSSCTDFASASGFTASRTLQHQRPPVHLLDGQARSSRRRCGRRRAGPRPASPGAWRRPRWRRRRADGARVEAALLQRLGVEEDGGERGAELVREVGQEEVLGRVGALRPLRRLLGERQELGAAALPLAAAR